MPRYEYRIDWIKDWVSGDGATAPVPIPNATTHLNTLAAQGWEPLTTVPGTNAQTYSGLYITLRRPTRQN